MSVWTLALDLLVETWWAQRRARKLPHGLAAWGATMQPNQQTLVLWPTRLYGMAACAINSDLGISKSACHRKNARVSGLWCAVEDCTGCQAYLKTCCSQGRKTQTRAQRPVAVKLCVRLMLASAHAQHWVEADWLVYLSPPSALRCITYRPLGSQTTHVILSYKPRLVWVHSEAATLWVG